MICPIINEISATIGIEISMRWVKFIACCTVARHSDRLNAHFLAETLAGVGLMHRYCTVVSAAILAKLLKSKLFK